MKDKTIIDFLKEYENFTYEEIEDHFKEYLDECHEPVELAGMTIYASEMENIDPIMFRCACADFSSEEYEEEENFYYKKSDYEAAENELEEYNDLEEEEEEEEEENENNEKES